jgi:hypothetical protein
VGFTQGNSGRLRFDSFQELCGAFGGTTMPIKNLSGATNNFFTV